MSIFVLNEHAFSGVAPLRSLRQQAEGVRTGHSQNTLRAPFDNTESQWSG
jgi:hypothetical protein